MKLQKQNGTIALFRPVSFGANGEKQLYELVMLTENIDEASASANPELDWVVEVRA